MCIDWIELNGRVGLFVGAEGKKMRMRKAVRWQGARDGSLRCWMRIRLRSTVDKEGASPPHFRFLPDRSIHSAVQCLFITVILFSFCFFFIQISSFLLLEHKWSNLYQFTEQFRSSYEADLRQNSTEQFWDNFRAIPIQIWVQFRTLPGQFDLQLLPESLFICSSFCLFISLIFFSGPIQSNFETTTIHSINPAVGLIQNFIVIWIVYVSLFN